MSAKRQPERTLIGRNLERLLRDRGLSNRSLARMTATLNHVDIGRIITGATADPGADKLRTIAHALGVELEEFWADPEQPTKTEPSIAAFIASGLAADVTPDEMAQLATCRPPPGVMLGPASWWHVLQAVRLANSATQRKA